ncbi:MAG: hypothetical protein AB7P04_06285 [Bacteriovoracia bacterium]
MRFTVRAAAGAAIFFLSACAGDVMNRGSQAKSKQGLQAELADSLTAVRIRLHQSDFYSLTDPNIYSCAGDAKTFYDPLRLNDRQMPLPFEESLSLAGETLRPSFIKNVSVDLTDANAPISTNRAYACSFGNAQGVPPNSNCAGFDYGAVTGASANLGGSIVLLGGLQSPNYGNLPDGPAPTLSCGAMIPPNQINGNPNQPGVNTCSMEMYALGVETMPASIATDPPNGLAPGLTSANEPISTWVRLSAPEEYMGPAGALGSAASFNAGTKQLLLYGGSAPLTYAGAAGAGADHGDTWIYDLANLRWEKQSGPVTIPADIQNARDCSAGSCVDVDKGLTARSLFGYAAVAGIALSKLDPTGPIEAPGFPLPAANFDTTDRVVVAGGFLGVDGNGQSIFIRSTRRWNPTFGPEYIDFGGDPARVNDDITQGIDSHFSQVISTVHPTLGGLLPQTVGQGGQLANFATAFVRNYNANAGYPLLFGGYDGSVPYTATKLATDPTCANGGAGCINDGKAIFMRRNGVLETMLHNVATLALYPFRNDLRTGTPPQGWNYGDRVKPIAWRAEPLDPIPVTVPPLPDRGGLDRVAAVVGGVATPGLSLAQNDVVYFGGVNCASYLIQSTNCPGSAVAPIWNNANFYWRLGGGTYFETYPNPPALSGANVQGMAPQNHAGMAAARGLDAAGNPIVVAWGGINGALGSATDPAVYLLYNAGPDLNAGIIPTWTAKTPANPRPTPAINAQIVFSHVTKKFYLFGGYETTPVQRNSADTWELSVNGSCATGACTFSWRKLNVPGGLTCGAGCVMAGPGPLARRSHRMVEVNYNNYDSRLEYRGGTENTCTATGGASPRGPCSFGIFMEGGSVDGFSSIGDRWMFDPTANGGRGHWQLMNSMPPRHASATASIDYYLPDQDEVAHRTVMFGGETGLHSPGQVAMGSTFVPPTLGDTLMYNHTTESWTRVRLLGEGIQGYNQPRALSDNRTEDRRRVSFRADAADTNMVLLGELTPPPLAGHTMVTRTFPGPTSGGATAVAPLRIPEVYLFGGRKKDGTYLGLDHVYKFCAGSTGEDYATSYTTPEITYGDGSCDAYDETKNPGSFSPVPEAVGRWLRRRPSSIAGVPSYRAYYFDSISQSYQVTGDLPLAGLASYLGASTYDSSHDRTLLFGGLMPAPGRTHVTEARSILSADGINTYIFEYVAPTRSLTAISARMADASVTDPNGYIRRLHGHWEALGQCAGSPQPTPRYGHQMGYDQLHKQVVVIGGYNLVGSSLTQDWIDDGVPTSTQVPEIWTAKRDDLNKCYTWKKLQTFGNVLGGQAAPVPVGGLAHPASFFIQGTSYTTGFYTMNDQACIGAGPQASGDPDVNRLLAGGVYIDIDRQKLGKAENLLLNLTFYPFSDRNQAPSGRLYDPGESAYFRVHLQSTGLASAFIQQVFQPRYLSFTDDEVYPRTVQTLSVVAPPTGSIRQEQIVLPISADASIDRIRIERYSGSAILIDASVYRLGQKGGEK